MPAPSAAVVDGAITATCPSWCAGHRSFDEPREDGAFIEHSGDTIEAGGQTIALYRAVWLTACGRVDIEPTRVQLNGSMTEGLTIEDVRAFAAALADTAAAGGEGVTR